MFYKACSSSACQKYDILGIPDDMLNGTQECNILNNRLCDTKDFPAIVWRYSYCIFYLHVDVQITHLGSHQYNN